MPFAENGKNRKVLYFWNLFIQLRAARARWFRLVLLRIHPRADLVSLQIAEERCAVRKKNRVWSTLDQHSLLLLVPSRKLFFGPSLLPVGGQLIVQLDAWLQLCISSSPLLLRIASKMSTWDATEQYYLVPRANSTPPRLTD